MPTHRLIAIEIPFWSIALLLLIPPAIAFHRARRRRQRQLDHRCLHCGYDLRATPDRCPECGKAIARGGSDSVSPRPVLRESFR